MVSRAVAASPDLAASFASTAEPERPLDLVAVFGSEGRRLSSDLVLPHRVATLPQERREVRPGVAELVQRCPGFLDDVACVRLLAGKHRDVEGELDGAQVGQRLAGIAPEGAIPVHRRMCHVELAEPSAQVRECMAHERVDLSAPRVRLDRPLGASDAFRYGCRSQTSAAVRLDQCIVLLVASDSLARACSKARSTAYELRPAVD